MASAWGQSWGEAWGSSWAAHDGAPPDPQPAGTSGAGSLRFYPEPAYFPRPAKKKDDDEALLLVAL